MPKTYLEKRKHLHSTSDAGKTGYLYVKKVNSKWMKQQILLGLLPSVHQNVDWYRHYSDKCGGYT
jgi:hypothetical protein